MKDESGPESETTKKNGGSAPFTQAALRSWSLEALLRSSFLFIRNGGFGISASCGDGQQAVGSAAAAAAAATAAVAAAASTKVRRQRQRR